MAAGIIQGTVTTTEGETVELSWLVDDTGTPTKWWNVSHLVNSAGNSAAFGSGTNGVTVPRVTVATDDTLIASLATKLDTLHDDIAAATVDTVTTDQASNADGLPIRHVPGETHLGEVGGITVVKTITMTADTSIMASADIIADTQQLDAAFRKADGTGVLQSLTVFDLDDNTAFAFDVYIHNTSTSLGSENSGITITDANAAAGILGVVSFAAADAKDLINGKAYHKANIGLPVIAVSGTDDLYFSIVNGSGTPTFAGGSIPIRVGILRD